MRSLRFLTLLLFLCAATKACGATLSVGHSPAFDFQTIGEAVEAASAGDVLSTTGGIYDATHGETFPIEVTKTLTIRNQGGGPGTEIVGDATHSVLVFDTVNGATLEGLTIRNGRADQGGGLRVFHSRLVLSGCVIRDNTADMSGGGIRLSRSDLTLIGCRLENNRAIGERRPTGITNGEGGAIRTLGGEGSLTLIDCLVSGNSSGIGGAAFRVELDTGTMTILDSTFTGNVVEHIPFMSGVVTITGGVDVYLENTRIVGNEVVDSTHPTLVSAVLLVPPLLAVGSMRLVNSVIEGNRGMGGIHHPALEIVGSRIADNDGIGVISSRLTLENSQILNNSKTGVDVSPGGAEIRACEIRGNGRIAPTDEFETRVGGLYLSGPSRIQDSWIVGNTGYRFGSGGIQSYGSDLRMTNCVIMGNEFRGFSATSSAGLGALGGSVALTNCVFTRNWYQYTMFPINSRYEAINAASLDFLKISNSIIWEGTRPIEHGLTPLSIRYSDVSIPFEGEGNTSEDPLFLQPWDGASADLRLPCHSPCIDAGTSEGAPFADIGGTRRPRGAGVDMGAYENCALDLTGDRVENGVDLLYFPSEWYEPVNETNIVFDFVTGPSGTPRIDSLDLVEILREQARN